MPAFAGMTVAGRSEIELAVKAKGGLQGGLSDALTRHSIDFLDDMVHVLVHVIVQEADHVNSKGFDVRLPPRIVPLLFLTCVTVAIEFDRQPRRRAEEVDNVRPDAELAAKLEAVELLAAKPRPEDDFRS